MAEPVEMIDNFAGRVGSAYAPPFGPKTDVSAPGQPVTVQDAPAAGRGEGPAAFSLAPGGYSPPMTRGCRRGANRVDMAGAWTTPR